jgi:transcriptional regulator with XRE-family HTH domain
MGQRIQAKRREVGLTQEQLAELTDLDRRTIQKIEAGTITSLVTTVQRIRKAVGCRYDDLLPD